MDLTKFQKELTLEMNKKIIREVRDDPTARLINLDQVTHEEIKDWLHSLGSTTWSIYTVFDGPGDDLAAKWLLKQLGSFYDFQASRKLELSSS